MRLQLRIFNGTNANALLATICLGLFLAFSGAPVKAQCLTAPGTGNITGNVPFGDPINWANPNRVELSDELWARAQFDAGQTTKYLWVSDFNFLLPAGATVLGIEVYVEKHAELNSFTRDASIRLIKGGTIQGQDKAAPAYWAVKDQVEIYGGPNDLWGSTWTDADIMDIGFGVVISATRDAGANNMQAFIDYIGIIVYYDDGNGCILPMQLGAFDARDAGDGSVELDWTTLTESNTLDFRIERSTNGIDFQEIGSVAATGYSQSTVQYNYRDTAPLTGQSFYRLRQIDMDGQERFSPVTEVIMAGASAWELEVYPNPSSGQVNVRTGMAGDFHAELYDLSGRRVLAKDFASGETMEFDLQNMERGMYVLRMTGEDHTTQSTKIVLR